MSNNTKENNPISSKWLRPFLWAGQQLIAVFHYLFDKPLKALLITLLSILILGWIVKSWDPRQVIEINYFEIAEMDSVSMEEQTFENLIEDRLAEIQRVLGDTTKLSLGAEGAVAEESIDLLSKSSILKNKNLLEDIQGDNQNGLDIGGFSVDRLRYEWRRFRYDIVSISGDVVVDEDQTLQIFMREDKYHRRWKLSGHPANFNGVERASKELADSIFTHLFPYAMGYYYVKTADLQKAAKTFKYVRQDHPRFVESQVHIADLYAVIGESEKAVAYYENSSSEEPGNESLRLKKVDALIQSAQSERAEQELIKLSNEADDEGIRSYAKAKLALIDTNRTMEDEIEISESIISGKLDVSNPEVFDDLKDIQSDTILSSLQEKVLLLKDSAKFQVLQNMKAPASTATDMAAGGGLSENTTFSTVFDKYWR